MHVGAEGEGAVLHVEGEAEDLQVAGGHQPQHAVPADVSRVVEVDVGTRLGDVVAHTGHGERGVLNGEWTAFMRRFSFVTRGHPKRFTILPNIHPFVHTFTHTHTHTHMHTHTHTQGEREQSGLGALLRDTTEHLLSVSP